MDESLDDSSAVLATSSLAAASSGSRRRASVRSSTMSSGPRPANSALCFFTSGASSSMRRDAETPNAPPAGTGTP